METIEKKEKMWNKAKPILKLLFSCAFVAFIFQKIDLQVFADAFRTVDISFYFLSVLMLSLANIIQAYIYFVLIQNTAIKQNLFSLIKINFIAFYYSLFLPTNFSVDAVRWYKVTGNKEGRMFFLSLMVYTKSILFFIIVGCGLIPFVLYGFNSGIKLFQKEVFLVLVSLLVVALMVIAYFSFNKVQLLVNSLLTRLLPDKLKKKISLPDLSRLTNKKFIVTSFGSIFLLTVIMHFFMINRVFLLTHSLSLPIKFIDIAWMSSMVLLLQLLPISISGIGIREGAYAYLFVLFNLPAEKGVVLGVLLFSHLILFAIAGWLIE